MEVAKPKMAAEDAQLNPLRLKAIAMKLRHRVHGFRIQSLTNVYSQMNDPDAGSDGKVSTLHGPDNIQGLKSIFVHPFSFLLLCLPLGICSGLRGWGMAWTFWLNILGIIPLAKFLGDTTEELAAAIHNDTLSGLLNATLGNAVEMILTVQTLRKGLLGIVKSSLLGSILSNLLLVLGTAFFLGGLSPSSHQHGPHHIIHDEEYQSDKHCIVAEKEQLFSVKGALVSMGLQLLACMTCALPTVFAAVGSPDENAEEAEQSLLSVSRIGAVVIGFSYVAYVVFQLCTHKRMLSKDDGVSESGEDEEDGASLTVLVSITLMTVITIFIAVSSELLVDTIDHMVEEFGVPEKFIGVVLLPFAGNACEHASAVRFGIQDRPGLVIGIAVGSSTQIALLVVPFAVLVGWYLGQPMSLDFGILNTAVLLLSVLVVLTSVIDGRSNWLKGFMLCTAYIFTSILYWYDV
mmetsp:Transcript_105019/g.254958  ORF Transcript_105019/g.254958 Transcript_105019/m.254958 type:complete len:461 (-) Transcript_105019:222-1604(-)